MAYLPNTIYHVFNQGNNRQQIFLQDKNYIFFLCKVRKHLLPYIDILAYCLMPNHFHFLIHTSEDACKVARNKKTGSSIHNQQILAREWGVLLSGYTKAINKQEGRTGSLFRGQTKYKECFYEGFATVDHSDNLAYAPTCFRYVHQNPVKAGLVAKSTEWLYSSAMDYAKLRNGTLCNQVLAQDFGLV